MPGSKIKKEIMIGLFYLLKTNKQTQQTGLHCGDSFALVIVWSTIQYEHTYQQVATVSAGQ
jgi:hypothetical protein